MWTNNTLRAELGERGFFETNIPAPTLDMQDVTVTVWERNTVMVLLVEHRVHAPQLLDYRTLNPVDPDMLGVRNPNIQEP